MSSSSTGRPSRATPSRAGDALRVRLGARRSRSWTTRAGSRRWSPRTTSARRSTRCSSRARSRARVHMGLGHALTEEFVVEGGVPVTDDAEVAQHHPAGRDAAGRVHPRRGAAARGAVRRQGRRRDRRSCRPRARWPARCTRSTGSARTRLPDEGLARRRAAAVPTAAPRRGQAASLALSGATVVTSLDPVAASSQRRRAWSRAAGSSPSGRRRRGGAAPRLLRLPGRPGQRLRAHPPLLGAGPRDAVRARSRRRTSSRSSSGSGGGSTARSTSESIRAVGAGRRLEALRAGHDGDRRPPRLARTRSRAGST